MLVTAIHERVMQFKIGERRIYLIAIKLGTSQNH
jgi:hypothetical protein